MSDSTVIASEPAEAQVRSYVAQVRAELGDLPAEEVEDLTFGMEADLGELQAEPGVDLLRRLGPPQAYAAELRAAAGLPPRSAARAHALPLARERARAVGSAALATAPWLRELRGAWWVARGVIAGGLIGGWLGTSVRLTLAVIALTVASSIWLGLRTRTGRWWWSLALINIVAVALAPLLLAVVVGAFGSSSYPGSVVQEIPPQAGVYNHGEIVGNLYAYDAAGRRLNGVRLFDQTGQPVAISGTDAQNAAGLSTPADPSVWVPSGDERRVDSFPAAWFGKSPWDALTGWVPPVAITPVTPDVAASPSTPGSTAASTTSTSTRATSSATGTDSGSRSTSTTSSASSTK